jgi:SurA N-terminal domain/PPIC-type PPIASE domain
MITILRKHHRWLMIVIAILAVPFVFYFNKTDLGAQRSTDLGRIYDRPVTLVEFTRNARLLNLASNLGLNLGNDLMTVRLANENDRYAEFTWNRLVLRHEAEQLGIRPSSSEITAFVKTLPRFHGETGFDINKYNEFTKLVLPSVGLDESQIEEVVSDQLTLNRVKDLLGMAMQLSDSENKENYEKGYGKMDVAVVRLRDEDFQKDVKVTDDDIAKSYEAQKAQLKSEEIRRVEFVTFTLTEAEKKLTGKERVEPLQKVADRANDFTQALLEKGADFGEIASRFQTPVAVTGQFTAMKPDPQLAAVPQLTQYSFQLTQQAPFSDPVQGPDGFYILHLLDITEAHPLSLEEAKSKIAETLKSDRLRELISTKGAEVAHRLREALKSGEPLEKTAEQVGLKLERVPAFALLETPAPKTETNKEKPKDATAKEEKPKDATAKDEKSKDLTPTDVTPTDVTPKDAKRKNARRKDVKTKDAPPKDEKAIDEKAKDEKAKDENPMDVKPKEETLDLQSIKSAVAVLNPGEVSEFVPVAKGGLVAVLEKRAPGDPSGYETAKAQFELRYLAQRRGAIFIEWMRERRRVANVSVGTS